MKINKGQKLQFKGAITSKWIEVTAREDFDNEEQFWKLSDSEGNDFTPKSENCQLRFKETKKAIKTDIDVWKEIEKKVGLSNIKRYPWNLILGDSLTRVILRLKMSGKSAQETYNIVVDNPNVLKMKKAFPEHAKKLEENIYISVCARFGKNNSSLNLFRKEFSK